MNNTNNSWQKLKSKKLEINKLQESFIKLDIFFKKFK